MSIVRRSCRCGITTPQVPGLRHHTWHRLVATDPILSLTAIIQPSGTGAREPRICGWSRVSLLPEVGADRGGLSTTEGRGGNFHRWSASNNFQKTFFEPWGLLLEMLRLANLLRL